MISKLLIISGCHPGSSGLGRVITKLIKDSSKSPNECRFIFRSGGLSINKYLINLRLIKALICIYKVIIGELIFRLGLINVNDDEEVILIHPQSLGFEWCIKFIERSNRPVWLYLMDSSYFCVRSYNHIDAEASPCMLCIGGQFFNADSNGCIPFPRANKSSSMFVRKLIGLTVRNKIKFIAQNYSQKSLIERHFDEADVAVKIAGLWANDWLLRENVSSYHSPPRFDVVFHGAEHPAKGVGWTIELAKSLPNYKFLFPFKKTEDFPSLPENCYFHKMSWESGLKSFVKSSRITIVPSLWSAPIEGALIKSIALAKIVAVVDNITAFSSEIPDNVIVKLPVNTEDAAMIVDNILMGSDVIDEDKKIDFINEFEANNINLLSHLHRVAVADEGST